MRSVPPLPTPPMVPDAARGAEILAHWLPAAEVAAAQAAGAIR